MSSLSMLLGNYVSHDCIPSTRTNKEVVNESLKQLANKALEYSANGSMIATSHSDQ